MPDTLNLYSHHSVGVLASDSIAARHLATDSIASDSIVVSEPVWGITLQPSPSAEYHQSRNETGASWIVLLMMIPFIIVAIKMKNSSRFIASLFQDLTSVRERHSIFDTTVRETSLLFFLIVLTTFAGGVLLGAATEVSSPLQRTVWEWIGADVPVPLFHQLFCICLMSLYLLFMWTAYNIVGRVFESMAHTRLWVRGFAASTGLLGLLWLPCALICISRPDWTDVLIIIASIAFILAKLAFIWKGFRIFSSKGASWVLFLYYLCSLEMVPVIITVAVAGFYI